jgi:DNA-binding NtrC family response regulator
VLVVDDEPSVCAFFSRALEVQGHEVTCVLSGEEALAAMATASFEVVLTDKNLPGIDGVEVARRARVHHPDAAVLLVTGFASAESAASLVGVADEYLSKPVHLAELRERIASAVERRRARRAVRPVPLTTSLTQSVMLLEPDLQQCVRLAKLLRASGYRVKLAGDISGLEETAVDALVANVALLPETDWRFVWRQQGRNPEFRMVALSEGRQLDAAVQAIAVGAEANLDLLAPDEVLGPKLIAALGPVSAAS